MSDTLALLERLVAIDTTSRESNLALIELVETLLGEHGIGSHRTKNADATKANLVARIGPEVEGGVVLSAHTDCVPVDGQRWRTDPFELTHDGDRLVGRGTTDMKGFLAAALALVPEAAAADLQRPLYLALSYDEELGTLGAPALVEDLVRHHPAPSAVIVGEPTSMRPVTAHKGVRSFTTVVSGKDGHSSKPELAANAVAAAARLAVFLDDLAAEKRAEAADGRFDPPYTTFNLATIAGGQAINIVPARCELTWEYRPVPADDSEELKKRLDAFARDEVLPRLQRTWPGASVDTVADAVVPTLDAEEDGAAERLVRRLTGSEDPAGTVPFGTDGGHFQAAGMSTVVCGPGDIDQAHQPDEYLEVSQLEACERMLGRLLAQLTMPAPA